MASRLEETPVLDSLPSSGRSVASRLDETPVLDSLPSSGRSQWQVFSKRLSFWTPFNYLVGHSGNSSRTDPLFGLPLTTDGSRKGNRERDSLSSPYYRLEGSLKGYSLRSQGYSLDIKGNGRGLINRKKNWID